MTFTLNPKWEKSVQAKGMARFRVLRTNREADGELISWKERGRPTRVFNDPLLIVLLSPVKYEGVKVINKNACRVHYVLGSLLWNTAENKTDTVPVSLELMLLIFKGDILCAHEFLLGLSSES